MIDIQYLINYCEKKQIDPYLVKNGDLPRISAGFSEISIGSKGLIAHF